MALDRVSLSVPDGKFVSIVGPSGCGKSTLLQIVGGLSAATTGEVMIDGDADHRSAARQDRHRVPGAAAAAVEERARERRVSARAARRPERGTARSRARAAALWSACRISPTAFRISFPAACTSGSRSRAGWCAIPRLLLMDEPFAALDEQTRTRMWGELLQIWAASGATDPVRDPQPDRGGLSRRRGAGHGGEAGPHHRAPRSRPAAPAHPRHARLAGARSRCATASGT